jgi:uncharacterized membrane protein YkgB
VSEALLRRATGVALVVGPALLLLDNLLHPKELVRGKGHEEEQLRLIAENATRWQVAHLFGFLALVVFAVAVLGLAVLVGRSQPRLALWGGVLAMAGLFALAGAIALDGFTWGVLGDVSGRQGVDEATLAKALDEVQNNGWSQQFYATGALFLVGMLLIAVGLARARLAPTWGIVVFGAGIVMVGVETLIVSRPFWIAGSAIFLVGGAAVGGSVFRTEESG